MSNFILLVTDDEPALDGRYMAYLPNLRRLFVEQGATLAALHGTGNLCGVNRWAMLSGQYPHQTGATLNENCYDEADPSVSLATAMQAAGYRTMLVGKYLNGYAGAPPCPPPGWADWYVDTGDAGYYNYSLINAVGNSHHYGAAPLDYSTDVLTGKMVDFLTTVTLEPFFLLLAPFAPHGEQGGPKPAPRHLGAACSVAPWQPPSWNQTPIGAPDYLRQCPPISWPEDQVQTCRTMLAVDDMVGRLEQLLIARGVWHDTYVFYLSDNGMHEGEYRLTKKGAPYVTRLPGYARGPTIPVQSIAEPVQNLDIAPTVLELAGGSMAGMRGVSLVGLLEGTSSIDRELLYQEQPDDMDDFPGWRTVRTTPSSPHGLVRYTEYTTEERELYDLSLDPWQLRNAVNDPDWQDAIADLRSSLDSYGSS